MDDIQRNHWYRSMMTGAQVAENNCHLWETPEIANQAIFLNRVANGLREAALELDARTLTEEWDIVTTALVVHHHALQGLRGDLSEYQVKIELARMEEAALELRRKAKALGYEPPF